MTTWAGPAGPEASGGPGPTDTGLHQNLAAALAYALGLPGGIFFLFVEKQNRYVRFHAMQSVVTFAAASVVYLMLVSVPLVGQVLKIAFMIGVVALWILLMYKALNGQWYKVPFIGDWAEGNLR